MLQDKGFIFPSLFPLGAPGLFDLKKDGCFHLCIDYRELNKLRSRIAVLSQGWMICLINLKVLGGFQKSIFILVTIN